MSGLTTNFTPPVIVTLAQCQGWADLDGTEIQDQVQAAVDGANQAVVDWLGWNPCQLTETVLCDGLGSCELILPCKQIVAVNSITINEVGCQPTIVDLSQGVAFDNEGFVTCAYNFPSGRQNIQVNVTRGFYPLPAAITNGTLYTFAAHLAAAGVDFNTTSQNFGGVTTKTWDATGPGTVPRSAATLLRRYQLRL